METGRKERGAEKSANSQKCLRPTTSWLETNKDFAAYAWPNLTFLPQTWGQSFSVPAPAGLPVCGWPGADSGSSYERFTERGELEHALQGHHILTW